MTNILMKSCSTSYVFAAAAAAKSLQSCPTLCDPIDGSPPGSAVPGILQARTLELPFPSPMHESEKWKWSRSVVSDPQRPNGLQPTRLLHPWDSPGKSTGLQFKKWLQDIIAYFITVKMTKSLSLLFIPDKVFYGDSGLPFFIPSFNL